jgi:2-dehydro-3-deoxyphosphogluconate aldolase/(4S)-4-hydroxy-2-oxoglutarate aldolase
MTASGSDTRAARTRAVEQAAAVAVVRLDRADAIPQVADALVAGGVTAIELTLTTPGALEAMAALRGTRRGAMLVGAGSVLTAQQAADAIAAGAEFLVSPVTDVAIRDIAHAHDVPWMPGGYTPTELAAAARLGADLVKLFPADALGPRYLAAVLAPMPQLRVMPTGGVVPGNVAEWLTAGAAAVGLGSALVDPKLVTAGDFATITERARHVHDGVERARGGA